MAESITLDDIYALFKASQAEADRRFVEADRRLAEANRLAAERAAEADRRGAEADRRMKELEKVATNTSREVAGFSPLRRLPYLRGRCRH